MAPPIEPSLRCRGSLYANGQWNSPGLMLNPGSEAWALLSSGGGSHMCGIKADGTAWCFGYNNFGEHRGWALPQPVLVLPPCPRVGNV